MAKSDNTGLFGEGAEGAYGKTHKFQFALLDEVLHKKKQGFPGRPNNLFDNRKE